VCVCMTCVHSVCHSVMERDRGIKRASLMPRSKASIMAVPKILAI